jgi:hypothetical protein
MKNKYNLLIISLVILIGSGSIFCQKEKVLIEWKDNNKQITTTDKFEIKDIGFKNDTNSTRGSGPGMCKIKITNNFEYKICIYIDNVFESSVAPYSETIIRTGTGQTSIIAAIFFTDGVVWRWPVSYLDCQKNQEYIIGDEQ